MPGYDYYQVVLPGERVGEGVLAAITLIECTWHVCISADPFPETVSQ